MRLYFLIEVPYEGLYVNYFDGIFELTDKLENATRFSNEKDAAFFVGKLRDEFRKDKKVLKQLRDVKVEKHGIN